MNITKGVARYFATYIYAGCRITRSYWF